jgi:hypothetical protein
MDHAEVLERIETAVAGPGGLARLVDDPSPEAVALRQHVAGCQACAAEWRAWSLVSLGLASAEPDTIVPRPDVRDRVMAAVAARPRLATTGRAATAVPVMPAAYAPPAPAPSASGTTTSMASAPSSEAPWEAPQALPPAGTQSGISSGPRRRSSSTPPAATPVASSSPRIRWLLLGAAAAVLLFVAGAVLGRQLGVGSSDTPRAGDPGRVLAEAATILQGGGYGLARLQTPEGDPGGVVVVSPGSGRIAVVSPALDEPTDGARYVCILERDGVQTQVGYMRWEPTASGGSLAYWAGPANPPDLGLAGDTFIVQLDSPGAEPALTGEFQG